MANLEDQAAAPVQLPTLLTETMQEQVRSLLRVRLSGLSVHTSLRCCQAAALREVKTARDAETDLLLEKFASVEAKLATPVAPKQLTESIQKEVWYCCFPCNSLVLDRLR